MCHTFCKVLSTVSLCRKCNRALTFENLWQGGAMALFNSSCMNLTRCAFRNNSAFGWCRGGGAIYTQALGTPKGGISWVNDCRFEANRCPDKVAHELGLVDGDMGGGGAISRVGDFPDEIINPHV